MVAIDTQEIERIADSARQVIFPAGQESNERLVINIKRHLSVTILYTSSAIAYGYIRWDSRAKAPEIIVSRKLPLEMQTFTIAHELGHLFLHWGWTPGTDLSAKARKQFDILDAYHSSATDMRKASAVEVGQEKEADRFAQYLLMPTAPLKRISQDTRTQDLDYLKYIISHDFQVTTSIAYIRLKDLSK